MSDDDEALAALIEQWRGSRRPELADQIQRLTVKEPEMLAQLWKAQVVQSAADHFRIVVAPAPDDPRMTVAFIKCLYKPRWSGSGAKNLWRAIFDRLIALRDPRAIGPLRDALRELPHFQGIAHSKWVVAELTSTLEALEKACAAEAAPAAAESEFFVRAKKVIAVNTVDLVWANPDDDETRLVVADALLEKNDPWGELITLQMRLARDAIDERSEETRERSPKAIDADEKKKIEKRIASIIHTHAQVIGGPIAFIATKDTWRFEKGFLFSLIANRSQVPRRRWEEAAHAPHWATVHELTLSNNTPQWWIGEMLKNPATNNLRVVTGDRGSLRFERRARGDAWRITKANLTPYAGGLFDAFFTGLPPDELGRVTIDPQLEDEGRASERLRQCRSR